MKTSKKINLLILLFLIIPNLVFAGLVTCPDCKSSVSEYATTCPKCGCPSSRIKQYGQKTSEKLCTNCSGKGVIQCKYCYGKDLTKQLCTYCNGKDLTEQTCTYCNGKDLTLQACTYCYGKGIKNGKSCVMCNATGKKKPCVMCKATGKKKPCVMCKATGKKKPCVMCKATGTVTCSFCDGNGKAVKKQGVSAKKYAPTPSVIETQIDGEFEGWEGETIVKLSNGQIWQQTEYYYEYHYSYMPDVLIYKKYGQWKMKVDGLAEAVGVERIK